MKRNLIQAYNELLQIPVAGPAVKSMFMAQSLIERVISQMPDDPATEEKAEKKPDTKNKKKGD